MKNFETFHPDRMTQRILGMGDVVSLVEKAQDVFDQESVEKLLSGCYGGKHLFPGSFIFHTIDERFRNLKIYICFQ